MKRDFTHNIYIELLNTFLDKGYFICSLKGFLNNQKKYDKIIILRHDVDKRPENALRTAKIEYDLGVTGSYFFRTRKNCFIKNIINEISELGHEIGYHYEDLSLAKGDFERAVNLFEINLNKLREFYPVQTICMHGSPLSKYDNKDLWKKYDYRYFGIICEPYFDLDFNEFLYLTDTGRRWDGTDVSVRDKMKSKFNYNFRNTQDIIDEIDRLPDKIMVTIHSQRWNNSFIPWVQELVMQNIKNIIKRTFFVKNKI